MTNIKPIAPPKIIFFDIDETLYRKSTNYLPPSIYQVIHRLHEKNILVAIATGRSLCALPDAINQLIAKENIDILSSINGQYNQFQGKPIACRPLDKKDIQYFTQLFNREKIPYAFVNDEKMIASENHPWIKKSLANIGDYEINPNYYLHHDVYQILVFVDQETEKNIQNILSKKSGYKLLRWHDLAVDLLPEDSSKAQGIAAICSQLGIDLSETMAFGDGHNDAEMFATVGFAVAMGDALPELLPFADYQTGTLEEDGILRALENLGVI